MLRERLRLSIGCLSVQFIRQWGRAGILKVQSATFALPVSCKVIYLALAGDDGFGANPLGINSDGTTATVYQPADTASQRNVMLYWLIIGAN